MIGAEGNLVPIVIVGGILVMFVVIGFLQRSREMQDYGFVRRSSGRIGGGAAIASNWMSAASFLGMAGLVYLKGYFALAYVIGWTGGYVLLLVLMSGQIRRFGKYTAPDFVGDRYDSPSARLLSALISVLISIIYCMAQMKGIALVFSWLFGIDYRNGVILGGCVLGAFIVISGMLGAAKNQQLQYTLLITTFLIPLMFLAHRLGLFWLLPQFSYGPVLESLARDFRIDLISPFAGGTPFQWIALCFTLMVGTAGLPHVLSRFYTVPNIRDGRWSLVWGLFFISIIYWSAPAYAAFARFLEAGAGMPLPAAAGRHMADIAVIRAAVMGGLPPWVVGILAAGAVCAAFYAASGLLMTGAASLSYDIYFRIVNPAASEGRRMRVAKGGTLALLVLVMLLSLRPAGLIAEIAAMAFALAGNTIFPAFLLGIWWGRANRQGVMAGMLTGVVVTALPVFLEAAAPGTSPVPATSSAIFGVPIVLAVMIVVSLLTPPPPVEMRRFLSENVHGYLD